MEHAYPKKVIGIGRAPLRPEPFSLGIEHKDNYEYRAFHIYHELDLMMEYLDKEKPDVIINFAAQGEGAVSWKHSWRFFETNCVALSKLTEELMEYDWLERFVQIGTSELYGSVDAPAPEDAPIKPSSPYAASKAAFDLHLMSISRHLEFPMNIIRPSNCYCPGQLLHRIIPKAIVCGFTGQKLPLHGGGRAEKSYIHARDLAEVTGDRLGQDARYWLDSMAIYDDLGWAQEIRLEEGLKEMVEWGNQYIDQLKDWPMDYQIRS
jgi:dTDP-glucose 4,6-dehydratase